jgi:hypothetical protein
MALVDTSFSSLITFTRASSTATFFNSARVLTVASTNVPRFDYNPSTLAAQGLLIEEQRTNSIRNNTMVGAVAGTPGTVPTNWNATPTGAATVSVVSTGTENGITYIDVRFQAAVGETLQVRFEGTTQIVAADTQTWTSSFYAKIASGSTANCTLANRMIYRTDTGVTVTVTDTSFVPTTANLATQRFSSAALAVGATIARVTNQILFTAATGAVDITLRIGLPQLEQGAFATSVIPTSTVAVTRSADVASINTLSPWFNATSGTLFAEFALSGFAPSAAFPASASISDNTSTNRINLNSANSGAAMYAFGEVNTGGVQQAGFYGATGSFFGVGAIRKYAIAYATNDFAFTTQGLAAQTDAIGTVPTVSRMYLGVGPAGASAWQNGYLRRITYYPRRLTNLELQTITA